MGKRETERKRAKRDNKALFHHPECYPRYSHAVLGIKSKILCKISIYFTCWVISFTSFIFYVKKKQPWVKKAQWRVVWKSGDRGAEGRRRSTKRPNSLPWHSKIGFTTILPALRAQTNGTGHVPDNWHQQEVLESSFINLPSSLSNREQDLPVLKAVSASC